MTDAADLHARLLAHARDYNPTVHHRTLLEPYRDVLLLWRAKFMSYEQIAGALTQHGIRVSPAGVGLFCRRTFTKAELNRARLEQPAMTRPVSTARSLGPPVLAKSDANSGRRGPKIARDDY